MDNSNFCCLVACVCVLFGDRDYKKMIFSRESTYIYIYIYIYMGRSRTRSAYP